MFSTKHHDSEFWRNSEIASAVWPERAPVRHFRSLPQPIPQSSTYTQFFHNYLQELKSFSKLRLVQCENMSNFDLYNSTRRVIRSRKKLASNCISWAIEATRFLRWQLLYPTSVPTKPRSKRKLVLRTESQSSNPNYTLKGILDASLHIE